MSAEGFNRIGARTCPTSGSAYEILNALRLPARLTAEQTAKLLGVQIHDVSALIKAGLLKPLGSGPRNCVKYFATCDIENVSSDRRWLDAATKAVSRRKKFRNNEGEKTP